MAISRPEFFFYRERKLFLIKSSSRLVPSFSCRNVNLDLLQSKRTAEILVEWNKRIHNWGKKLVSQDRGVIARGKIKIENPRNK